jgi:transcriptional regulator with XRE-family HTH domain
MARQQSGVNTRGIGLELQRLRKDSGLSVAVVGEQLGVSASTISRIETSKREPTSEEVASILTVLGVKGVEREKLIDQARRQGELDMMENATSTEQSRNFLNFEQRATRLVEFQLMLVPGLGQTADYAHAALSALRVRDREEDLEPWVGLRMRRQAILTRRNPPELHWIMTELSLRQPIGGARVMAKQVRHLIDQADRPNVTISVLPASVAEHPGLLCPFLIMDFAAEPTVVHVEDKTTGLFLDDEDKVALYKLTAEKLTDLALDEQRSLRLLKSIASDLERERGDRS